jgi:hypothetical protein
VRRITEVYVRINLISALLLVDHRAMPQNAMQFSGAKLLSATRRTGRCSRRGWALGLCGLQSLQAPPAVEL